jgi:hypothetical protein
VYTAYVNVPKLSKWAAITIIAVLLVLLVATENIFIETAADCRLNGLDAASMNGFQICLTHKDYISGSFFLANAAIVPVAWAIRSRYK